LIFGLIAVATGFGSVMAAKMGKGNSFLSSGGDSSGSADWSGFWNGVGAVTNSLQAKPKKGKETRAQRQQRIIGEIVRSALWRLENMPGCKDFIQGGGIDAGTFTYEAKSRFDPTESLNQIFKAGNVQANGSIAGHGHTIGGGAGPRAGLELHTSTFNVNFGKGNPYGLNAQNARTLILLHELKHAHVGYHPGITPEQVDRSNEWYNDNIAKKCFGVSRN
jgi:hypothetical protein